MKIAVGLFGIHYLEGINHWCFGEKANTVDYRKTYKNCKDNIYNCFGSSASIDYFSATYRSIISQELLNDYNFCKIQFDEIDNSTLEGDEKFIRRNRIFKKTIEMMINPEYHYDFALITRYDMNMLVNINSLQFDFDKINIFYKVKWDSFTDELIDDNFYYMRYDKLRDFYNNISLIPENISSHLWCNYLTNLHMLIDGSYYSHESPIYYINRIPLK